MYKRYVYKITCMIVLIMCIFSVSYASYHTCSCGDYCTRGVCDEGCDICEDARDNHERSRCRDRY